MEDLKKEAQEYVDQMINDRGYVLDYHKVLALHDFEVMKAANKMVHAAYLKPRLLSAGVKELLFIVSLIVLRAPRQQIEGHIKVALNVGVTKEEILEAIQITLPEAGIVAFQTGVEIWADVVGAEKLEPTAKPL